MSKNVDLLAGKAKLYQTLGKQIENLQEQRKGLSIELKEAAEKQGEKYDDKGSCSLSLGKLVVKSVVKENIEINEEVALEILREKKLDNCFKEVTIYEFDESAIEEAFLNEKLTKAEVKKMFTKNPTRSIWVGEQKEPE